MMKTFPDLVICPHCDTVYRKPSLTGGDIAVCENCAAVLCRTARMDIQHWLALSATAAVAFIATNVYPVVSVDLYGQHNKVTLAHALISMAHAASSPIASTLASIMIVTPFAQIVLLGWVLFFACIGRRAPGLAGALGALAALRPWSMTEICLIGILVTTIKLSNLLDVATDTGTMAMTVLALLMIIITNGDTRSLWDITRGERA
jgi:paraquat-inducible protein A